ncbi:MAG: MFS transporter [Pseudomonadota bacterium]
MSDIAASTPEIDDRRARKAVWILVWGQSVLGAQMPVHFILGGLVGQMIAHDPAFATLPISMTVLGTMLMAPFMSSLMDRWGRRTGFVFGALTAALAALIATYAIEAKDFVMFCGASLLLGVYMSAHGFYRFAATDLASPEFRPKAISWVMAGGLAAAVIGPQVVKEFEDWLAPIPFAGAYQALIVLNLIGVIPMLFLDIPVRDRAAAKNAPTGRPMREILRDSKIVVAMLCAMISYALMNLVMTSTPLAMIACGFETGDAAEVVSLHVLAMFAPSFFTGPLIVRFGAERIIAVGLLMLALCAAVAVAGITFAHFGAALILLGLGWNFGFIGATALLTAAHKPEERAKVQGLNDFLVFGLVTVASFSSGALMAGVGWSAVNVAMLPLLAIAAAALAWQALQSRRAKFI